MARRAVGVTLGQSLGEGRYSVSAGMVTPASVAAGTAKTDSTTAAGTLTTNVAAAVAVLVADAALPTQAHVNTLNTAWGLLATAIAAALVSATAAEAAVNASAKDMVLDFDTTNIASMNAVKAALNSATQILRGSDAVTQ